MKRIKNNKLLRYMALAIVAVLITLVARIAYAYLTLDINEIMSKINLTSDVLDEFKFINGDPLTIVASPENMPEDGDNLVVTSKPKITLKANGTTNEAAYTYYVYINIPNNTFVYTTENNTPELILNIIDANGNEITNIQGLDYGTTYGVSGFDITTYSGFITIADNLEITSNSSEETTVHEYTITLTYLNLAREQTANFGKTLNNEIIISKKSRIETLASACENQVMGSCFSQNHTIDTTLYYHDSALENGAGDNSYRYAGANPNNYVCFGSDATTCPADNLYRIIGIFDNQVKLIKNASIGDNCWSGSESNITNTWSDSTLNTDILNGTYINSLGATWIDKIATTNWKVGGMAWSRTNTAKQYYDAEVGTSSSDTTYPSKIGLMYANDFGFAAAPSAWTTALFQYKESTIKTNNWLAGMTEWTISYTSNFDDYAYNADSNGFMNYSTVNFSAGVRPSFYLNSGVTVTGGSGTSANPYRIS